MKILMLSISASCLVCSLDSFAANENFIPAYTVGNVVWSETLKDAYNNECVFEKQGKLIPCDHRYGAPSGSTTAAEMACRTIGASLPYRSDIESLFLQFDHFDYIIPNFNDGWLGQDGKSIALTDKGRTQIDAAFGGEFIRSGGPGYASIWTNQPIVDFDGDPAQAHNFGLYTGGRDMRVASRSGAHKVRCVRRLK